jgi:hypothetical protein
MASKTLPTLPDDLYSRAYNIGRAAVPLITRPEQKAARDQLLAVLDADRPADLPAALSNLIRARQIDANGKRIPKAKQHLNRMAWLLSLDVQTWLDEARHGRAA